MKYAWLVLLVGCSLLAQGCKTLLHEKPPCPWYAVYEPVSYPLAHRFAWDAFMKAQQAYGPARVPVRTILLRYTKKLDAYHRYAVAEDFSLTECADASNGLMVVYVDCLPDDPAFFPTLAHECAHLLNPYIKDWYMEGFATLFSDRYCHYLHYDWSAWEDRFGSPLKKGPYALSYRMMRELQGACPMEYDRILHFVAEDDRGPNALHIDIDRWLETLPPERQAEALGIIEKYAPLLHHYASEKASFTLPQELKRK